MILPNTVHKGDCLELMSQIEKESIDMILCDLPYGTTACKWDTVIPFEPLWAQYKRVIKDNGAIVLFGSQPFTSALVMSNPKMFKYEWIWEKSHSTGFALSKIQPLKYHENILVFGNGKLKYNPEMWLGNKNHFVAGSTVKSKKTDNFSQPLFKKYSEKNDGIKYPKSIQKVNCVNRAKSLHPTQKPLELMEYLVKTYTNEGDMVLDNAMGSGTTNLACIKLNRKSIGIEKEKQYYDVAVRRALEYCH